MTSNQDANEAYLATLMGLDDIRLALPPYDTITDMTEALRVYPNDKFKQWLSIHRPAAAAADVNLRVDLNDPLRKRSRTEDSVSATDELEGPTNAGNHFVESLIESMTAASGNNLHIEHLKNVEQRAYIDGRVAAFSSDPANRVIIQLAHHWTGVSPVSEKLISTLNSVIDYHRTQPLTTNNEWWQKFSKEKDDLIEEIRTQTKTIETENDARRHKQNALGRQHDGGEWMQNLGWYRINKRVIIFVIKAQCCHVSFDTITKEFENEIAAKPSANNQWTDAYWTRLYSAVLAVFKPTKAKGDDSLYQIASGSVSKEYASITQTQKKGKGRKVAKEKGKGKSKKYGRK